MNTVYRDFIRSRAEAAIGAARAVTGIGHGGASSLAYESQCTLPPPPWIGIEQDSNPWGSRRTRRIIGIHSGVNPVYLAMEPFSVFLAGIGYPETEIRSPQGGRYSCSL